jgi:hypothetical protein
MAALNASRNTPFRGPIKVMSVPLKSNAKVYKGGVVMADSTGYGIAGATATSQTVLGIATADTDNTGGSSGALSVDVLVGEFYLNNSGSDAVDQTRFGLPVYLVDDNTVSKTNGTSTESQAGIMTGFDSNGVWVKVGVI